MSWTSEELVVIGEAEEIRYNVVVNDEEQYSIWPVDTDVPAGWALAGHEGTKAECLEHITLVWTDMRPRSLRERMVVESE